VNYAQLLFPDFSLILCGYLVCQYTALNRTVWAQVESLVYYFLFPVLLFHSIVKSPLELGPASSLIGAGVLMGLAGIALAYSLPYLPWIRQHIDRREHAGAAQVAFRFNSFIALAMAERLTGAPGLLLLAVLIGVCVPMFNVGAVWPMVMNDPAHAQRGISRELIRNPLILATASGLVANLLGFRIPVWLEPGVSRIGGASLALGLLAAGAGHAVGVNGTGQAAVSQPARHQAPVDAIGCVGLRPAVQIGHHASHRAADLCGHAHGLQLLRAGRAHGLQRRLCGWACHAVHPAGHGEFAVCAGFVGICGLTTRVTAPFWTTNPG
jgi:predicted permease